MVGSGSGVDDLKASLRPSPRPRPPAKARPAQRKREITVRRMILV
jgi:hypothetical protein